MIHVYDITQNNHCSHHHSQIIDFVLHFYNDWKSPQNMRLGLTIQWPLNSRVKIKMVVMISASEASLEPLLTLINNWASQISSLIAKNINNKCYIIHKYIYICDMTRSYLIWKKVTYCKNIYMYIPVITNEQNIKLYWHL